MHHSQYQILHNQILIYLIHFSLFRNPHSTSTIFVPSRKCGPDWLPFRTPFSHHHTSTFSTYRSQVGMQNGHGLTPLVIPCDLHIELILTHITDHLNSLYRLRVVLDSLRLLATFEIILCLILEVFWYIIQNIVWHQIIDTIQTNWMVYLDHFTGVHVSQTALGRLTNATNSHRQLRSWFRNPRPALLNTVFNTLARFYIFGKFFG